ncbi:MAG: Rieske (2Fe-2S) protein [Pseudomonadales bacterium]|nr:Rieske (2Fe-2S) protein [Pseudomonadales bacterium]
MNEALLNYLLDKLRRFGVSSSNQLSHVTTYTRELPISLDRMYENAIDGEHLPYLHSSTFSYIDILESGPWGWRAKAGLHPRSKLTDMEIKLVLNKDEFCWKTTTLSGLGKGTEIWTHAIPLGENRIKVIVDFYVPKLPAILKDFYAEYYIATYEKLYDEDLMMMSQRQQALDFKKASTNKENAATLALGNEKEIRSQLPFTFEFKQHRFVINESNGELVVYSAMCPHMLSPLENETLDNGVVECPWHAYRFDVKTGECVSGQSCRLKTPPALSIDPDTQQVVVKELS